MNIWMYRVLLACVAILVLPGCEEDDDIDGGLGDVTIQGRVQQFDSRIVASNERRAAFAGVAVTELRTGVFATTDRDGVFVLRRVRAGQALIRFQFAGSTSDYALEVTAGKTVDLGYVRVSRNGAVAISQADAEERTEKVASSGVVRDSDGQTSTQSADESCGLSAEQAAIVPGPEPMDSRGSAIASCVSSRRDPVICVVPITNVFRPAQLTNRVSVLNFTNVATRDWQPLSSAIQDGSRTNAIKNEPIPSDSGSCQAIASESAGLYAVNYDASSASLSDSTNAGFARNPRSPILAEGRGLGAETALANESWRARFEQFLRSQR